MEAESKVIMTAGVRERKRRFKCGDACAGKAGLRKQARRSQAAGT